MTKEIDPSAFICVYLWMNFSVFPYQLDQKIFILDEADCEYLNRINCQSDPKLVELFKSKSPWE